MSETRTEYRVLAKVEVDEQGTEWLTEASPPLLSRDGALRLLTRRRSEGLDHHLEQRTVTYTDWTPVEAPQASKEEEE